MHIYGEEEKLPLKYYYKFLFTQKVDEDDYLQAVIANEWPGEDPETINFQKEVIIIAFFKFKDPSRRK